MRAPEPFTGTRLVARPAALDAARWPQGAQVFRLAPDEALVAASVDASVVDDAHAIVERETGFVALWLARAVALDWLERECDWDWRRDRSAFAQGLVAGLPVKLWFEPDRVLVLVPAPFADALQERVR